MAKGAPHPAASSATFAVRGTNGIALEVESNRGVVTITASDHRAAVSPARVGAARAGAGGDIASSVYYAFGTGDSSRRIEARLGRLGRISVRFHPSGAVRVTDTGAGAKGCAGPARAVRHLGTFTGTIEFRGENGYTAVDTGRARGSVGTPLVPGCSAPAPGHRGGQASAALSAAPARSAILSALNRRNGVSFEATTTSTGIAFSAFSAEPLGVGMIVSRSAYAFAPAASFAFDNLLSSARVTPPPPFSGSAGYQLARDPRLGEWAGNLRVAFPGASTALAGPDYQATLGPAD
jgi:hypothetical protein